MGLNPSDIDCGFGGDTDPIHETLDQKLTEAENTLVFHLKRSAYIKNEDNLIDYLAHLTQKIGEAYNGSRHNDQACRYCKEKK